MSSTSARITERTCLMRTETRAGEPVGDAADVAVREADAEEAREVRHTSITHLACAAWNFPRGLSFNKKLHNLVQMAMRMS